MPVSEWVERAALASLTRQEESDRIRRYQLACSAAAANRQMQPQPEDFGLSRNYNLEPGL